MEYFNIESSFKLPYIEKDDVLIKFFKTANYAYYFSKSYTHLSRDIPREISYKNIDQENDYVDITIHDLDKDDSYVKLKNILIHLKIPFISQNNNDNELSFDAGYYKNGCYCFYNSSKDWESISIRDIDLDINSKESLDEFEDLIKFKFSILKEENINFKSEEEKVEFNNYIQKLKDINVFNTINNVLSFKLLNQNALDKIYLFNNYFNAVDYLKEETSLNELLLFLFKDKNLSQLNDNHDNVLNSLLNRFINDKYLNKDGLINYIHNKFSASECKNMLDAFLDDSLLMSKLNKENGDFIKSLSKLLLDKIINDKYTSRQDLIIYAIEVLGENIISEKQRENIIENIKNKFYMYKSDSLTSLTNFIQILHEKRALINQINNTTVNNKTKKL